MIYSCRATQAVFDKCVKDTLGQDRPHLGYFAAPRVHHSDRPKPQLAPHKLPESVPDPPDFKTAPDPKSKFTPALF